MSSQAEQLTPSTQNTEIPEQQRQEAERKKLDIQEFISSGLTRLCLRMGEHMNPSHLVKLNHAINSLEVGHWMKENGYSFRNAPRFRDRYDLYTALARKIEQEVVLYLEFGVWQGASLRTWSNLLRNPLSSLHGFDSFEGLPEAWDRFPKGTFDVKGVLPQFDDPALSFTRAGFMKRFPSLCCPRMSVFCSTWTLTFIRQPSMCSRHYGKSFAQARSFSSMNSMTVSMKSKRSASLWKPIA